MHRLYWVFIRVSIESNGQHTYRCKYKAEELQGGWQVWWWWWLCWCCWSWRGRRERSVGSPGLWQLQMPADKFPLNSLYSSPPKVQGWQRGGGGFKQSLKFSFPYNVYHWLTKCYILLLVQCSKILSLKWFSRGSAQCKVFCEKFQFHYCKVLKVFSNIFLSLAKINFQKK